MSDTQLKIRCSSLGKIMTEPKLKTEKLSAGAKTYIREQAAQDIFGVDFLVTGKPMEKGIEVEDEAIGLLNRVRGLGLAKNTERRSNDWLTGECDLYDAERRRGHDIKCSWSIATFPIAVVDCEDKLYDWQVRGYMMLWDADEWEVNFCLVNTPEHLLGYEPLQLHIVDHIPEALRITTWQLQRDAEKEANIRSKVEAARLYYAEVVAEFDRTHRAGNPAPVAAQSSDPAAAAPYTMSPRLAALLAAA
jgi:hypothetical protein